MTDTTVSREAAAQARAAQVRQITDRPQQRRASAEGGTLAVVRGVALALHERAAGASTETVVTGYASVTESPYEMYDFFGPYTEVVTRGAFEATLSRSPLVEFTVNHGAGGGLPMAHTRNGTLVLTEDETGLRFEATVDTSRADVADLVKALQRGDMAEASFKFRIDSGVWSPDYTEFRINAADLEHGDVSSVNFGANPAASSGVRAIMAKASSSRALSDPEKTQLAVLLGQLAAADDAVDEVMEALTGILGLPPEECDCCGAGCTCGDCVACTPPPAAAGAASDKRPVDLRAALLDLALAD